MSKVSSNRTVGGEGKEGGEEMGRREEGGEGKEGGEEMGRREERSGEGGGEREI